MCEWLTEAAGNKKDCFGHPRVSAKLTREARPRRKTETFFLEAHEADVKKRRKEDCLESERAGGGGGGGHVCVSVGGSFLPPLWFPVVLLSRSVCVYI